MHGRISCGIPLRPTDNLPLMNGCSYDSCGAHNTRTSARLMDTKIPNWRIGELALNFRRPPSSLRPYLWKQCSHSLIASLHILYVYSAKNFQNNILYFDESRFMRWEEKKIKTVKIWFFFASLSEEFDKFINKNGPPALRFFGFRWIDGDAPEKIVDALARNKRRTIIASKYIYILQACIPKLAHKNRKTSRCQKRKSTGDADNARVKAKVTRYADGNASSGRAQRAQNGQGNEKINGKMTVFGVV